MAYCTKYYFDNIHNDWSIRLKIRNGTCFKFLDCIYKYYHIPHNLEHELQTYFNISGLSDKEAIERIKISQLTLSFLFDVPIYERYNLIEEFNKEIPVVNSSLSKLSQNIMNELDIQVKKFKLEKAFYIEILDLHNVASNHYYNANYEDSLLYYFKLIEKLAKKNYLKFKQRNYTSARKRSDKLYLKTVIEKFFESNLEVKLTQDMLNNQTDLLFKDLQNRGYGNVFSKISLFITKNKISVDIEKVTKLVKTRNILAHGDTLAVNEIVDNLTFCNYLAREFIALYFFRKKYKKIRLPSEFK